MTGLEKKQKPAVSRPILGSSPPVLRLVEMIEKVAPTKTNILVIGESGTGKELIARMIHELSPIKNRPFVPVNCGAIPETLIESEMFGHKRGSFTGATHEKQGLFEVAHGGTLFLDEVGELPLSMQVKLLRAIQERSFRKVGGTEDIKVDVRIIAATNRDLEVGVSRGVFREDLYYRLNVIQLKSPPLRERGGDIQVLAESFLEKFSKRAGRNICSISKDALSALQAWSWPGNVRELENVLERGVTVELGEHLMLASLPLPIQENWRQLSRAQDEVQGSTAAATGGPVSMPSQESRLESEEQSFCRSLGLPLPRLNGSTIESIDLKRVVRSVEKAYLDAAKKLAAESRGNIAEILGLSAKELKALEKRIAE
jgi:two-component system response regulator PilR (NtrC family)